MKLGALLPGEYLLVALPLRSYANVWRDRALVERLAPLATRLTFAAGDRRTYELRLAKVPQ